MGSNPTPRAYLGDLYDINKNENSRGSFRKKGLSHTKANSKDQSKGDKEKENDTIAYRKINSITKTCTKQYFNNILKILAKENPENAQTICDYIVAEETEINIKNSTKEGRIKVLVWLSNFYRNKKSFKDMEKQDILDYLNNLRKPITDDPTQRWIGSYNGRQIILNKFFRWLYHPDEPTTEKERHPFP